MSLVGFPAHQVLQLSHTKGVFCNLIYFRFLWFKYFEYTVCVASWLTFWVSRRKQGDRKFTRLNESLGFQQSILLHTISFTISEQICKPSFHFCSHRWIYVFWMSRSSVIVVSFSCSSHSSLKTDGAGKLSRWVYLFLSSVQEKKKKSRSRKCSANARKCDLSPGIRAQTRATWGRPLSDQWPLTQSLCGTMNVPELPRVISRNRKSTR